VSASQRARSVSAAQASGVAQIPCGHAAPLGQAAAIARHSQPAACAHASALPFVPHASLTTAAGTGSVCAGV
jgi:hypothetical protein